MRQPLIRLGLLSLLIPVFVVGCSSKEHIDKDILLEIKYDIRAVSTIKYDGGECETVNELLDAKSLIDGNDYVYFLSQKQRGSGPISGLEKAMNEKFDDYINSLKEIDSDGDYGFVFDINRKKDTCTLEGKNYPFCEWTYYYKYSAKNKEYTFYRVYEDNLVGKEVQKTTPEDSVLLQKELMLKVINNGDIDGGTVTYKLSKQEKDNIQKRTKNQFHVADTIKLYVKNNEVDHYEIYDDLEIVNKISEDKSTTYVDIFTGECTEYKTTYYISDRGNTVVTFPYK